MKIQTRIINEEYLRSHPDVQLLLSGFIQDVLEKRPEISENLQQITSQTRKGEPNSRRREALSIYPLSVSCRASLTSASVDDILAPDGDLKDYSLMVDGGVMPAEAFCILAWHL
ncbi:unnamed protein product, partial [Ranitomeya imitator]